MPSIQELISHSNLDQREARLLLSHVLKWDEAKAQSNPDFQVNPKSLNRFKTLVKRRLKHEPIAHLLESQPFYEHSFKVNRHTLIPRPETEYLVDLIIKFLAEKQSPDSSLIILDIGTGSGCIALSLADKFPKARVIGTDISRQALNTARYNAKKNGAKPDFIQDNLLGSKTNRKLRQFFKNNPKFDLTIVANLPYLPSKDKPDMMPDVIQFEPHTALFAKQNGLELIVKLLNQIRTLSKSTKITFSVFLEFDPRQSQKLLALSKKLFPKKRLTLIKDQFKKNRFISIS